MKQAVIAQKAHGEINRFKSPKEKDKGIEFLKRKYYHMFVFS